MPEQAGPQSIKPTLVIPVIGIAMCAGAALALVNAVTAEPIAQAKKAEKAAALAEVMPAFGNDPAAEAHPAEGDADSELDPGTSRFYAGRDGSGAISGWGIESATDQCYSSADGMSLVFGVDPDGRVQGIRFLKMLETPGLGTKVTEAEYLEQYLGKGLDDFNFRVAKKGGDVEAITGATITSDAVGICIEQGLREYKDTYQGKDPGPPAPVQEGGEG